MLKPFFDKFNFKNNLFLKLGRKIVIFLNLTTLFKKLQKHFRCYFCDSTSISFIVISLHQILLTWWNAYRGCQLGVNGLNSRRSRRIAPWKLRKPWPRDSVKIASFVPKTSWESLYLNFWASVSHSSEFDQCQTTFLDVRQYIHDLKYCLIST